MKSKKLQARAPNLNNSNKQDSSTDEGGQGGPVDGGGGSRSGCPSTASSMDSGAPPHPGLPPYGYPGAPPPFHFPGSGASMKLDSKSPGQQSDGKDSTGGAPNNGYNSPPSIQPPVINPFEPPKLQSPGFDPMRRFDMPYMPPPPAPFNTPGVMGNGPPFPLPHFLQQGPQQRVPQGPPPPRTLDV